jgi:hypothetical protein
LQDPEDWLVDYLETVKLMGGTREMAMQSIQVHLSGVARCHTPTFATLIRCPYFKN